MPTKNSKAQEADTPSYNQKSGVTPSSDQRGDPSPVGSSSLQVASSSQRIEEETIIPWPGEPGSLGYHGADSCDPSTRFSIELSKSLAARLRHGHRPWVEITPDGWTRLLDLLAPSEGAASAGRRCPGSGAPKGRYELGLCAVSAILELCRVTLERTSMQRPCFKSSRRSHSPSGYFMVHIAHCLNEFERESPNAASQRGRLRTRRTPARPPHR